jgi:hypothetical protein
LLGWRAAKIISFTPAMGPLRKPINKLAWASPAAPAGAPASITAVCRAMPARIANLVATYLVFADMM